MITIFNNKSNLFLQNSYNNMIKLLPFHKLSCTCGRKGNLIKHAYYIRSVKVDGELVELKILRILCKACKKTHAILPDWLIPYSRTLFNDQVKIIKTYLNKLWFEKIMVDNILLDESNLKYVIKKFNEHWKERLKTFSILLDDNLVFNCFKYFNRQFMQIKCTSNILFSTTHIT